MKNSFVKIAVPTLALGLAFAPIANAAQTDVSQKTELSVKTDSKTTVSKIDSKAKEAVKKQIAKEKEAIKKLTTITKNISKVESSVNKLSTATTNFYAKAATTPVSVKVEADFYASTSGKLKANTNQLKALKKQLDHVAKKYKGTDAVAATYKKISDLNNTISVAGKNLTDLHAQFKAKVNAEESIKQLTSITNHISKVEASVAELSKATTEFYAKAATDSSVTAHVEADFYTSTSGKLKANTNQLKALKKQLDYVAKISKDTAAVAAANKKIDDLNIAISTANKNLTDLHTQFKAKVKEQEIKEKLASITNNISKVETGVIEHSKATVDFYAKAATDSSITAQVEADFYKNTSGKLLDSTKHLLDVKKQLDVFAKYYGNSADVTAAYSKIAAQNKAIALAVEALTNFHTNFKPVAPTTTNS